MFKIHRQYTNYGVDKRIVLALEPSNSYIAEDKTALSMIINNVDLSKLKHMWSSASLKARVSRFPKLRELSEYEISYIRFKLDEYLNGSYCSI